MLFTNRGLSCEFFKLNNISIQVNKTLIFIRLDIVFWVLFLKFKYYTFLLSPELHFVFTQFLSV